MKSVAVIGGGITGLTAAFRLAKAGVPVTLYEGGSRVGGVIQSVRRNGFLAECGPNTILETSPKIGSLVRDLGLEGRRMYSDPTAANRYLVRNGRPVALPDSMPAFLRTRLFSPAAKLRLVAEPFIGRAAPEIEESVEQFVLRRLGREFLDYAINPLVGGVYAGNPATLSVKEAFPKLHALEQKYGSLIKGQVLGARERKRRAETSKQNAAKFSFDEGLQVLTDELRAQLGARVALNSPVTSICKSPCGWFVSIGSGESDASGPYSAVLFAGTAHGLAKLRIIADGAPDLVPLSEVYYPPVASVVLGFRREDVAHPLQGFGMLIPQVEGCQTLGAIFSSSLFPNRAPAGQVLLTSYLGGARSPELALKDPETLTNLALADLRRLLGVSGVPTFAHHFVFPKAIPQYEVGYGWFKKRMTEAEANCPGLFLAGHYRDGISLGDSIISGHDTAGRIQTYLESNPTPASESPSEMKTAA
ncbi:MAG TPA: protoporphyrinogen oxidase [Verrucomicrobiae bacterium]|nr:protoporphyrinogen oxidase [Verrucomicrobiae bacterium]